MAIINKGLTSCNNLRGAKYLGPAIELQCDVLVKPSFFVVKLS